jgi:hypothetical protein
MNSRNCSSVSSPRLCASSSCVEVGDHVLDRLHVGPGRVLQRLLHPGEGAVEHLPAQQVLDLLVGLPGLVRAPVVVLERPDGAGGVVGQRVELGLGQPGVVVRVGEQLPPLGLQRLVEQLADLLSVPSIRRGARLAAQPSRTGGAARRARAAVVPRRSSSRSASRSRCRPSTESPISSTALPDVVRRRERVGPAPPRPYR